MAAKVQFFSLLVIFVSDFLNYCRLPSKLTKLYFFLLQTPSHGWYQHGKVWKRKKMNSIMPKWPVRWKFHFVSGLLVIFHLLTVLVSETAVMSHDIVLYLYHCKCTYKMQFLVIHVQNTAHDKYNHHRCSSCITTATALMLATAALAQSLPTLPLSPHLKLHHHYNSHLHFCHHSSRCRLHHYNHPHLH